ncbi:CDP-alcohol phosphatidyltransferase family protein [Novosphingopyxis sp.]|uniref:CDP-alcohol phosphatidyltransferase family protein n=1 Tax=Novosphingopyxis sp. TaxID=2709690 RepID=UPI003B5AE89C
MANTTEARAGSIDRIQQNVLARGERRLLNWICPRLPLWVTPDRLTSFGIVGALMIFAGYAASGFGANWLWLAIAGYSIQWFGDSLDGSIARWRKIERPSFGYFIDHSCDGITTLLILAGIGFSPYVRLDVALVAMTGYLLLSIHAYLSVHVMGEMKLSYLAAGPTELRFVLIGLTIAMYGLGTGPGWFGAISGFDIFVGTVGLILIILFLVQTATVARRLASRAEQR